MSNPPQRRPDWLAITGVTATVVLHFVLQRNGPSPVFIIGSCVGWTLFVVARVRQDRSVLRRWGFRADNLRQASKLPALIFVLAALGMAGIAAAQGTLRFPLHLALLFLAYPVWGVVQQFLVLALVVSNLETLPQLQNRKAWLVVIGAVLFGLVHANDWRLVPPTIVLELLIVPLYLRDRNLWPLGLLHGWLGGLYYLWVLGRDMWAENFG